MVIAMVDVSRDSNTTRRRYIGRARLGRILFVVRLEQSGARWGGRMVRLAILELMNSAGLGLGVVVSISSGRMAPSIGVARPGLIPSKALSRTSGLGVDGRLDPWATPSQTNSPAEPDESRTSSSASSAGIRRQVSTVASIQTPLWQVDPKQHRDRALKPLLVMPRPQ